MNEIRKRSFFLIVVRYDIYKFIFYTSEQRNEILQCNLIAKIKIKIII